MRDYRTITAEEFLVDGLDMKIRWLARWLRKINKHEEIAQWVSVVTALTDLKQRLNKRTSDSTGQNTELTEKRFSDKNRFTISDPVRMEWQRNDILNSLDQAHHSQLTFLI